jgi:hypothetical protein
MDQQVAVRLRAEQGLENAVDFGIDREKGVGKKGSAPFSAFFGPLFRHGPRSVQASAWADARWAIRHNASRSVAEAPAAFSPTGVVARQGPIGGDGVA